MNDFYSERKALKDYISYIREERRRLSDEYWKSLARLRELDEKAEKAGQSDLVVTLLKVIEDQKQTVERLTELVAIESPKLSILDVINQFDEKKEIIEKQKIEEMKDLDEMTKPVKDRKRMNFKILEGYVASFLKEKGIPVSLKEIKNFLEQSYSYKVVNMSATMNQILELSGTKIERVGRGYYQYR